MAGHLGYTVGELLSRISSRELTAWAAYESECGPLGPARGDYHAAQVSYLLAKLAGETKPRQIKDYLLSWAPRRVQSGEDQLAVFKALESIAKGGSNRGDDRKPAHQVEGGHQGGG